jgi:hypothetical protein
MEENNKVTTFKTKQFREILNKVVNELDTSIRITSNLFRYSDRQKNGVRVKFISYGSDRFEPIYRRVAEVLNEVDGGGWNVEDRGSWYGDGSGWCVIKVYND